MRSQREPNRIDRCHDFSPSPGPERSGYFPGKRDVFLMAYNYGKTFKKDGKLVRYRYTDGKKSTKKLVAASKKKTNKRRKK